MVNLQGLNGEICDSLEIVIFMKRRLYSLLPVSFAALVLDFLKMLGVEHLEKF